MPIITNIQQLTDIILEKKYETKKSIKYNVCDANKKVLYISPDFSNMSADRGMPCGKYVKGSVPLFLDINTDRDFIALVERITYNVNQALIASGYQPITDDKTPISRWQDKKTNEIRLSMWCDIIHSENKGIVYSKIYDTTATSVNVTDLTTIAFVRPCICFRLSYSLEKKVFRLRSSISEMCIINIGGTKQHRMLPNA